MNAVELPSGNLLVRCKECIKYDRDANCRECRLFVPATQQVGYAACGIETDTCLLSFGYVGHTEHEVAEKVLDVSRREGFKGTAKARLAELGWDIRPIYAISHQPRQARK